MRLSIREGVGKRRRIGQGADEVELDVNHLGADGHAVLAKLPLKVVRGAVGVIDLLVLVIIGFGQRIVDAAAEQEAREVAGLPSRRIQQPGLAGGILRRSGRRERKALVASKGHRRHVHHVRVEGVGVLDNVYGRLGCIGLVGVERRPKLVGGA